MFLFLYAYTMRVNLSIQPPSWYLASQHRTGRRGLLLNLNGVVWCGFFVNYRLQKKIRRQKSFHGSWRSLKIRLRLPAGRSAGTHDEDCVGLVWRQHELLAQGPLTPHSHQISNPFPSACEGPLRKNLQEMPQQRRWAQGFCEPRMNVDEERLRQEGL